MTPLMGSPRSPMRRRKRAWSNLSKDLQRERRPAKVDNQRRRWQDTQAERENYLHLDLPNTGEGTPEHATKLLAIVNQKARGGELQKGDISPAKVREILDLKANQNRINALVHDINEKSAALKLGYQINIHNEPGFDNRRKDPDRPWPQIDISGNRTTLDRLNMPAYRTRVPGIFSWIPSLGPKLQGVVEGIVNIATFPVRRRTLTKADVLRHDLEPLKRELEEQITNFQSTSQQISKSDITSYNLSLERYIFGEKKKDAQAA